MKTAGHTILIALKQEPGGYYAVTLECSCGKVFAEKKCLRSEQDAAKNLVVEDGRDGASSHIARIDEALRTLGYGQPCAA